GEQDDEEEGGPLCAKASAEALRREKRRQARLQRAHRERQRALHRDPSLRDRFGNVTPLPPEEKDEEQQESEVSDGAIGSEDAARSDDPDVTQQRRSVDSLSRSRVRGAAQPSQRSRLNPQRAP